MRTAFLITRESDHRAADRAEGDPIVAGGSAER
jgi:hypothetical protein